MSGILQNQHVPKTPQQPQLHQQQHMLLTVSSFHKQIALLSQDVNGCQLSVPISQDVLHMLKLWMLIVKPFHPDA